MVPNILGTESKLKTGPISETEISSGCGRQTKKTSKWQERPNAAPLRSFALLAAGHLNCTHDELIMNKAALKRRLAEWRPREKLLHVHLGLEQKFYTVQPCGNMEAQLEPSEVFPWCRATW